MGKKKVFKREKKHVIFDEKDRKDYLTGFHKRKLAKKVKAKEKLDNLLKEEMKRIKQNQKESLQTALYSQRNVPEIEHLLKPVTIDMPEHTVTISEFHNWNSVPVTSVFHTTQDDLRVSPKPHKNKDEVEKIRKLIKEMKAKRIGTLKNSAALLAAKKQQKKMDKAKAKKMQKLLAKSSKLTKRKHKKKNNVTSFK